jgi:putative tryptophan/tyrosine transport system substrate-binding protein
VIQIRISKVEFRIGAVAIFVVALALNFVTVVFAADSQIPQVPRIGILSSFADPDPQVDALKQGLRDLGWVEGQNVGIEYRYANNNLTQFPNLATELVRLKVDVLVAGGEASIRAARDATSTIPIVMANSGDPVGTGLIASLSRPGGNMTGLSLLAPDLGGKRLELLKEIVPKVSRVGILWNPTNAVKTLELTSTEVAARALGVIVTSHAVRAPKDFDRAFAAIDREHLTALITLADPLTRGHKTQLAEFAAKSRLPMIAETRDFAEAGGLMTYGASLLDLYRRAATYVDKVLKGTKPGNLPVEQPTKFELVINLKTARALGLTIPQSVLVRADEVIR